MPGVAKVLDPVATAFLFVLGASFGSFGNVLIHRVPRVLPVVSGRSACPACGAAIAPRDNIPIASFVLLAGKCRHCGARISPRYLVVEIATAVLWVLLGLRFGLVAELPAFLGLGLVIVVVAGIDLEHRRIPNRLLIWAAALAVILLAAASVALGEWGRLGVAAVGAFAYGVPMLVLALLYPGGMGMGDVKLAAYLGFHLGWLGLGTVFVGAFLGFFLGSLAGGVLILVGKKNRKATIPFGPSMGGGCLLAVLAGRNILDAWLGRF